LANPKGKKKKLKSERCRKQFLEYRKQQPKKLYLLELVCLNELGALFFKYERDKSRANTGKELAQFTL